MLKQNTKKKKKKREIRSVEKKEMRFRKMSIMYIDWSN